MSCGVPRQVRCDGLTFRGTGAIANAWWMALSCGGSDAGILSGRVKCEVAPVGAGQVGLAVSSIPERRLYATEDIRYL